jgi:hypothetical protein
MIESIATVGLGWIISSEKFKEMQDKAGTKFNEISNNFHLINQYFDQTAVFLGEFCSPVNAGDFTNLVDHVNMLNNIAGSIEYSAKYESILTVCGENITPDSNWSEAKLFLLHFL